MKCKNCGWKRGEWTGSGYIFSKDKIEVTADNCCTSPERIACWDR